MIELVTEKPVDGEAEEIAMIDLFSIDGKVYQIPDRVRPTLSLQYLDMARRRGIGIAESWLAEELLGTEAYAALLYFPNITQDQWEDTIKAARAVAFGEVRPKATTNGNGARTKTARPRKRSTTSKNENGS